MDIIVPTTKKPIEAMKMNGINIIRKMFRKVFAERNDKLKSNAYKQGKINPRIQPVSTTTIFMSNSFTVLILMPAFFSCI